MDAKPLVFLCNRLLDHRVKVPEEGVVADEEMRFCAQSVEYACKLNSNVARPNNGHFLRKPLNVEEAIAIHAVFCAGDSRWWLRRSANPDEDVSGVDDDRGAVVKGNFCLILGEKLAPAVEIVNFIIC